MPTRQRRRLDPADRHLEALQNLATQLDTAAARAAGDPDRVQTCRQWSESIRWLYELALEDPDAPAPADEVIDRHLLVLDNWQHAWHASIKLPAIHTIQQRLARLEQQLRAVQYWIGALTLDETPKAAA